MFTRICDVTDSSQITKVLYDPLSCDLSIVFKNGDNYVYSTIVGKIFGELIAADSVGKYFAQNIRTKFPYRKIAA